MRYWLMDNCLLDKIQNTFQGRNIAPLLKMIANAERLEIFVAFELFVIGLGNLDKTVFLAGIEYGHMVAAKITVRHGQDLGRGPGHQLVLVADFIQRNIHQGPRLA